MFTINLKENGSGLTSFLPNTVKKMKQFLGEELKTHVEGFRDKISTETFVDGKECLKYRTDNIRFENCLDQVNRKTYSRSMQGHSNRVRINPKLQNHVRILDGWIDDI